MINNGDIFITKLERDFYGAFRIIKTKGELDFLEDEVFLIAITSYIDKEKPKITDKRLKEYLIEKRFFFDNTPNINIYTGRIIEKQFEYLGNIPLTQKEEKLKIKVGDGKNGGFPLCGQVQKDFGYQAFLEWRWQNENELMKKEHEEQSKKVEEFYKNRIMKPKKMMEDEQFWEIISLFDWQKLTDNKIVEPVIKHLSKLKVSDIKQFEENLAYKLFCLDTKEHAKNIGNGSYNEESNYVSVDFFLYARCKAVANGKYFYEDVLNNPLKMPKDEDFEVLLSLSEMAYEIKTKKEFNYSTEVDYETYSNKKGWE